MRLATTCLVTAALCCLASCASMENLDLGSVLGNDAPLDEATVARGLKEALTVGTGRAVATVGTLDGYLGNEVLRIALPPEVQDVAGTLRSVGLGNKVDELEIAMNRAAEQAAGEAVNVFTDAITSMTIADAWTILRGHDTAATDYFRDRTATTLTTRYRPIIESKLRTVGGYTSYESLVSRLESIPFVDPPNLDLIDYVTTHALSGLFTTLATEEQSIRTDPLSRTTTLLQRVFSAR